MGDVTKKDVMRLAQENLDELVNLVSELIQIPSENPTGTQRDILEYVKRYLEESGISYDEVGGNPEFPCIVAQMGKEEGFSIILNGHVDVVPIGNIEKWKFPPFSGEITDKEVLGRGTSDMKSGVACMLFAMRILAEAKAELKGNIRLHIVSDEESGGQYGTAWLCENGYAENADACLMGEPPSHQFIEIGQRGRADLKIKSYGAAAHGSLAGHKGDNAIQKLMRVLEHVDMLCSVKGHFEPGQEKALINGKKFTESNNGKGTGDIIEHVSANIGLIQGGTRPNMVPDYCETILDLRLPVGTNISELKNTIESMIAKSGVQGIEYELDILSLSNSTEMDAAIVKVIKKYAEEFWKTEVFPSYKWASSDARLYREKGIPTIQYGPSNLEGIHSYNECVDIEDIKNTGQIYLNVLCDLLGVQ